MKVHGVQIVVCDEGDWAALFGVDAVMNQIEKQAINIIHYYIYILNRRYVFLLRIFLQTVSLNYD